MRYPSRPRPTHQTSRLARRTPVEQPIRDREADFERFMHEDLARRQQLEKEARSVADELAQNLVDRLGEPSERAQWHVGGQ